MPIITNNTNSIEICKTEEIVKLILITFLSIFLKDLEKHEVISFINSDYIAGKPFPFNTINIIHHNFLKI